MHFDLSLCCVDKFAASLYSDEPVTRAWASYSSISRMLREVSSVARKNLFGSPPDFAGINGWNGSGHRWTTLENNFVLEACEDEYGGMVVDADRLPSNKAAFAHSLALSLSYWKSAVRTYSYCKQMLYCYVM